MYLRLFYVAITCLFYLPTYNANLPPVFTHEMDNLALSESTPIGKIVYTLSGFDPEGRNVSYGLIGTDHFEVDPMSGNVTLIKMLDREEHDTLTFLVTIKDRVSATEDSENDNLVVVPVTVIILDENDNAPKFENTPYEAEVDENAERGTTIFNKISVIDEDSVGEILDIDCIPSHSGNDEDVCSKFKFEITENTQNILKANVLLDESLDNNQRTSYNFQISATDGLHTSLTNFEIRVKDIQNTPPVFQGSLSAVIEEDSPIGTLIMKVKAKDGDIGEPRKIVYDLLTNPMDYFLLDSNTGELRTAKPLDREALSDTTGLISLQIRGRELIDGIPGSDNLTTALTQVSVTIKDVNDCAPEFDKKEYNVSLVENSIPGTPLALEMTVSDRDMGENSVFSLRLSDVSGVFQVEPEIVRGSSQVSLRVGKDVLDYENPNQRRFIILVIAEELKTNPKLSSTATVTISVIDANDNRPIFDQESYSASISESAEPGKYITTITAKDLDSGVYGDLGIRYSLSGSGSELFNINSTSGVITLADCHNQKIDLNRADFKDFDHNMNDSSYDANNDVSNKVDMKYSIISEKNSLEDHSSSLLHHEDLIPLKRTNQTCLDYEIQNTYFLSYKATDDLGKGQASVVSLRISVIDANDSPPVCESSIYKASVDEGSSSIDPPLIVKARDVDLNSDIVYSIMGDDYIRNLFEIDKRNGQINIKPNVSLDVNNLKTDFIVFDVQASDGIFSTNCLINITIRDVNNHAPQFLKDSYAVSILENSEIGTKVEQVRAIDLDINNNAEIKYRIQQGNFDDFSIDEDSGVVYVSRKLDYDHRNIYQIEILANDLGIPRLTGTTTLTVSVINVNDKDPYFTPVTQRAEVREDALPGTRIHKLSALDPDISNNDALEFAATEPLIAIDKDGKEIKNADNLRDIFTITRKGDVILNKKLDKNLFSVIRITVLVTDSTASTIQQGKGVLVISVININEIPPKFPAPWTPNNPIIKAQIIEELPVGTTLITLQAYDEDSTIGNYNISKNDYFIINESTGVISTKSRIDYEEIETINFYVTVTDTGIPILTSTAEISVDIVNINDNEPIFLQQNYSFNVLENSSKGTVIGKIEAKDYDSGILGEITYSLIGDYMKNFVLDSDTGIIMVANTSFFDREKISNVKLIAIATDKAPAPTQKSSTASIYVHILDINDNPPIFLQKEYSLSVAENAPINPPAALLQIKAEDKDEGTFGEIRYLIINGNEQDLFELDYITGILYPKKSFIGKQGKHILTVEARDLAGVGPFRTTTNIVANIFSINQHRPIFITPSLDNTTIEFYGDTMKQGHLITTVKAVDEDEGDNGKISYYLQIDNANLHETDNFIINETTGELWTKQKLERTIQSVYDLVLVAKDHGSPSQFETLQFLKISLKDINENRPEFLDTFNPYKMFITENAPKDTKVGKINAQLKYKDKGQIYYYMVLGNEDSAFYLDKISGIIFTNKSLDRETMDSYTLYILASNNPDLYISETERIAFSINSLERNRSVAKVLITVLDENDNAPIFNKNIYYAGINFKSSKNEIVIILNATDKDLGKNGSIEYIITGSNLYKFGANKPTGLIIPSPFSISEKGEIITSVFMNEYNQDRFELDVIAKEIESPERFAKAKVYIWVYDSVQLIRIILSKPPTEINREKFEIVTELQNATKNYIVIDQIRYHIDSEGRIRMDWCDLFFHAVDPITKQIVPVEDTLKQIDVNYDYLKDYYAGYAIENIVPAYIATIQDEFDFTLAALVALLVVLLMGVISFVVLFCCLKHWNISIPLETHKEDVLIKKQIIEDLNTTENPLWIEQKLKLYEEQELTMQVFLEADHTLGNMELSPTSSERRNSNENSQNGENAYATITPRKDVQSIDIANYATLKTNEMSPSFGFTGSTFQATTRSDQEDVTELI